MICLCLIFIGCRDELQAAWAVFTPLLHAIERKEVEVHQYESAVSLNCERRVRVQVL